MLAIAGGKGGAGKTTTTACLARALAEADRAPIAVDGDVDMPDLHVLTGTPGDPGLAEYARAASLGAATHSAVELPGVDVLPAGDGDVAALETTLSTLDSVDRPVLVDTPAGASPVVAATLRAASGVLLVSTPTRESLEDAAKTAAMARTLGTPLYGTVLTKSDGSVEPSDLLGCETLTHVPDVPSPLTDDSALCRYTEVLTGLNKRNI